jgi:hypothetical protein
VAAVSAAPVLCRTLRAKAKLGLQVVAFDYLEQELPFIVDGTVKASVGQDYWGWGYQSVTILYGLLQGKKFPKFVPQALPVVTTANVADYQKKWDDVQDGGRDGCGIQGAADPTVMTDAAAAAVAREPNLARYGASAKSTVPLPRVGRHRL